MSIVALIEEYIERNLATLDPSGDRWAQRYGLALAILTLAEIDSPGQIVNTILPEPDRVRVARMAAAAHRHLATYELALELSRNVAVAALDGQDVLAAAREAIRHRQTHFALQCEDPTSCAIAMHEAWNAGSARRAA